METRNYEDNYVPHDYTGLFNRTGFKQVYYDAERQVFRGTFPWKDPQTSKIVDTCTQCGAPL